MESLKDRLQSDMKAAMKGGEKDRLGVIRLILAGVKQREVDERIQLDDQQVLAVLDKMVKQRRESITQYQAAGREDLANAERNEIAVIETYLPTALTEAEIEQAVTEAIGEAGAKAIGDMAKVMALLKPRLLGRADMASVSGQVKKRLSTG